MGCASGNQLLDNFRKLARNCKSFQLNEIDFQREDRPAPDCIFIASGQAARSHFGEGRLGAAETGMRIGFFKYFDFERQR